jgi:hypothetical protein
MASLSAHQTSSTVNRAKTLKNGVNCLPKGDMPGQAQTAIVPSWWEEGDHDD